MQGLIAEKMRETIRIKLPDVDDELVIRGDISLFLIAYNIRYGWLC
jgi:hypothetical protein